MTCPQWARMASTTLSLTGVTFRELKTALGRSELVTLAVDTLFTHCSRFSDKTRNEWEDRHSFVKVEGKYDMLAMDYGEQVAMATN